jgi:drug/metabolite transporter (DMT)-like permease
VTDNPITRGSALGILAAVLFGMTTPLVKRFGVDVGAFATATLLYAGAAGAAGVARTRGERRIALAQAPRLAVVALFGAALAPATLAWGLQHTSALSGALLLNLEAPFTVLLAVLLFREPLGRHVLVACGLMLVGGLLLATRSQGSAASSGSGLAAVCAATLLWALDSTLTRPLADFDPRAVVFWKASLGATLSLLLAVLLGDTWPRPAALLGLVACGATGYGLSLRFYLRAQRMLGAARTGSLFALAPFLGAALAFALGDREGGWLIAGAAALFAAAAYLHVTEQHQHHHRHETIDHEHAHSHDDGHHGHVHEPPVTGTHTHVHHHDALEHDHPHGSDLHHRHRHR